MLSKNTLHSSAKAPSVVEAVSKIIEDQMTEEEFNDPQYSFRVYVIPKTTNNLRNADQAVTYAPLGSAIEMAVKLVERPKFRATKIIDFVRDEGFKEFSMHQFIGMWKSNSWKDAKKTLAIEIGGQWFWYKSVVPLITDMAYPLDYGKSACCVRDGAAGRC
jgi:hypothetical protein